MEGINKNAHEKLNGREKLKAILALFGTDAAREKFLEKCREYIEARTRAIHESYAPDAAVRHRAVASGPKQAAIHNQIMETLTRLAAQAENVSPLQRGILIEMYNRDVTAQIIKEYVSSEGVVHVEDEDEEEGGRKKGMSDTAYYHSLGKGY